MGARPPRADTARLRRLLARAAATINALASALEFEVEAEGAEEGHDVHPVLISHARLAARARKLALKLTSEAAK